MDKKKLGNINIRSEKGVAIALEAKRISKKCGKDFLEFEDLQAMIPVGNNNIRDLMRSADFPTLQIGTRKFVSVLALAIWSVGNSQIT